MTLKAECIFGHKWEMTAEQIADARSFGCAMCPTCGNAATITEATTSFLKRRSTSSAKPKKVTNKMSER